MKNKIKKILSILGYKLSKNQKHPLLKNDPFEAVRNTVTTKEIILFDIGANEGQTIKKMKKSIHNSIIYAFEPSEQSFQKIKNKYVNQEEIILQNCALGSRPGFLDFNEYSWSAMDSFLTRAYGSAKLTKTYPVEVSTVDEVFTNYKIPHINLLKTDTEGYELEVLKGAMSTLKKNKIQFILVEIFFNQNYINQASFGDIYNFLINVNFELVRSYDMVYTKDGLSSKTDALFINRSFLNE